jgi:protein PhnA
MMYLDEDLLAHAQATGEGEEDENKIIHRDSNGVVLAWGLVVLMLKRI